MITRFTIDVGAMAMRLTAAPSMSVSGHYDWDLRMRIGDRARKVEAGSEESLANAIEAGVASALEYVASPDDAHHVAARKELAAIRGLIGR